MSAATAAPPAPAVEVEPSPKGPLQRQQLGSLLLHDTASAQPTPTAGGGGSLVGSSYISLPPLAGLPTVRVDTSDAQAKIAEQLDNLHFTVETKAMVGNSVRRR